MLGSAVKVGSCSVHEAAGLEDDLDTALGLVVEDLVAVGRLGQGQAVGDDHGGVHLACNV